MNDSVNEPLRTPLETTLAKIDAMSGMERVRDCRLQLAWMEAAREEASVRRPGKATQICKEALFRGTTFTEVTGGVLPNGLVLPLVRY